MELIDHIPVDLSVERVLEHLQLPNDRKFMDDIEDLLKQIQPVTRPKGIYDVCYIEHKGEDSVNIAGVRFTSRVLRFNLDKVERVFPYVITCGTEVEEVEISSDDLMGKFALDTIKQMALGAAVRHIRERIDREYNPGQMSAMNPGSLEDWPICEQEKLFSIFGDVEGLIGVRLTDTFLMLPLKSVSGIYFPTEIRFESCQLCPRERCPGRRAPYDEKLKKKILAVER